VSIAYLKRVSEGVDAGRGRRAGARETILTAIRTAEPLSRVELAGMTGLTEASVSTTVRRLLDEGLVVETGRTPTGGKPRTMLRLDPAARIAVGVHLDDDLTTYVLTGQTGGVISRMTRPGQPAEPGELVRRLVADIAGLVDGSGVDPARCLGIGLVRPAPVVAGRAGDDLAERLAEATGWPVLLENDATAAAVGEHWVARIDASRPFVALYMGSGIGAGVVLDGVALRGRHANAGQFGHLCLQVDGPACWCGSNGCLEVLAGPQSVVNAALADPAAAAEASLAATAEAGPTAAAEAGPAAAVEASLAAAVEAGPAAGPRRSTIEQFTAIARAARAGAPTCRALLERSARLVAAAAESVVNLLDVDLLVLTGAGFAAASFVYGPAINARLAAADARTWHRSVSVTVSLAAPTASATGAAALVLQSSLHRVS
jgi:predicted NBD/HSP70 family sugar kinase